MQQRLVLASLGAFLLFAACDSTDPSIPERLELVRGEQQSGTAGEPVAVVPAVRLLDQRGRAIRGATVDFTIIQGAGSVAGGRALTDVDGIASPAAWILDALAGPNTLQASTAGVPAVQFTVLGSPGEPALLEAADGNEQSAAVATSLPVAPAVRVLDAHRNPIPGAVVLFAPAPGHGRVTRSSSIADPDGIADAGGWVLGTAAGTQTLTATALNGTALQLSAHALPGPPASLHAEAGSGQSAQVTHEAPLAPVARVRDRHGNPVPGASVHFRIEDGGGSLRSTTVTASPSGAVEEVTDAEGRASPAAWIYGPGAGFQSVRAAVQGVTATELFVGTAVPGPASLISIHAGQFQVALVGTAVATAPAVRVTDDWDNPVNRAAVLFSVSRGGGSAATEPIETDDRGIATLETWVLGPQPGLNTLTASLASGASVTFEAQGVTTPGGGGGGGGGGPGDDYDIQLVFAGTSTSAQQSAFLGAADRWQTVLTGGLSDVNASIETGICGPVPVNQVIDDLLVVIEIAPIDGTGGILGYAGPCAVRLANGLPAVGAIRIDQADVAALEAAGQLLDVAAHELGHVLGVGTLWGSPLLIGAGTTDPIFTGPAANAAFTSAGGVYTGGVPVEGLPAGPGTRDGHWRESILQNELMTGYINAGGNPLSAISFASLQDLGYAVAAGGGEPFTVPGPSAARSLRAPPLPVRDLPWPHAPVPLR